MHSKVLKCAFLSVYKYYGSYCSLNFQFFPRFPNFCWKITLKNGETTLQLFLRAIYREKTSRKFFGVIFSSKIEIKKTPERFSERKRKKKLFTEIFRDKTREKKYSVQFFHTYPIFIMFFFQQLNFANQRIINIRQIISQLRNFRLQLVRSEIRNVDVRNFFRV